MNAALRFRGSKREFLFLQSHSYHSVLPHEKRSRAAFTLIEIMLVVGIIGLIAAMGAPPLIRALEKQGMAKAVSDLMEVCSNARAEAIIGGAPRDVLFHPLEGRYEIAAPPSSAPPADPFEAYRSPEIYVVDRPAPKKGHSGQLPDGVTFEMLDVNLQEYNQSEWVRVRFYPGGLSDELTVVLRSADNQWRKITLEPTTGLASWSQVR